MGTIQKRDDNSGRATYQAKVRKKGFPPQSKTFSSHKDAEQWITETEAAMSRATFVDTAPARCTTLADLIDTYVRDVSSKKKGGDIEEIRLNAMKRDKIASYALVNLTPPVLAEYRDRRMTDVVDSNGKVTKKGVAGSTVNRELNLLHHMLEVARKDWGISAGVNAVSEVRRPKDNPPRDRRLEPHEELALLAACSKARSWYLRPVVELAIETAMRQGEIAALEWNQVDLHKQVVTLRWGGTKTNQMRGVPLSKRAVEILRGLPEPHTGRVFPRLTGGAVKQAFARVCDRIGLQDFTFHDTRHEATSRFVELGLGDTEVMACSGHKTSSMMRRYTHLRTTNLAKKLG